jgi:hypothetical protein
VSFEYWLYRADEQSSLTAYLQDGARSYSEAQYQGETDVGLQIAAQTGKLLYANGSNWVQTAYSFPPGQWGKFTIHLDLDRQVYSAFAGETEQVELCHSIALNQAKRRFIEQPGVNVPIEVPAYRMFNQVLFAPSGSEGSVTYLDDVSVKWVPTMHYQPPGKRVYFADDFESFSAHQGINNQPASGSGKWRVTSGKPDAYFIDNNTSFGEGINCLHARGGAELTAICEPKLTLLGPGTLIIDLDVFIRSDQGYPNMIPNPLVKSRHQTAIGLKSPGDALPALGVYAADGVWKYWDGDRYVDSQIKIAYDVWNHLQMALDKQTGAYQVVVQPVGELPTRLGQGRSRATGAGDLALVLSPSNSQSHASLYDNLLITGN